MLRSLLKPQIDRAVAALRGADVDPVSADRDVADAVERVARWPEAFWALRDSVLRALDAVAMSLRGEALPGPEVAIPQNSNPLAFSRFHVPALEVLSGAGPSLLAETTAGPARDPEV